MVNRLALRGLAQSGATDGQLIAWDDAANKWVPTTGTAGGGSSGPKTAVFKFATSAAGTGITRFYNDTGATLTILSIRAVVDVAPSGGSVVVDVNLNGTTVFTTQANRPTITTGNVTATPVTSMDVTSVLAGDYLTCDVDTFTAPASGIQVALVLS